VDYRAKFAVPDASSGGEVARLERERLVKLERQLSATLAAQTERDQRMAQLTDELALKSALLEQAEANATMAAKRAELRLREHEDRLSELKQQLSVMLAAQTERDQCQAQLADELALKNLLLEQAEANAAEAKRRAELELRGHADRLVAQTSLVGQKDAELVDMQAKLDELLLSRDQHMRVLEQAQSALQSATSRAADADERSQRACEKITQYETELAKVRAELEARKSKLKPVHLQLTGVDNEDRIAHRFMEQAKEDKVTSSQWSEDSSDGIHRNEG
jgi:chromosome segregation ATPase